MKLAIIILAIILSAYFIFTSGIPFEAAKLDSIAKFEVPYNVALSGGRIDLYGNYTLDDKKVRSWLEASDINPIYSDFYGVIFIQETMSYEKDIYFILDYRPLPANAYVYLRSWSNEAHQLVYWNGSGARKILPFNGYNGEILYQSGESMIMEVQ